MIPRISFRWLPAVLLAGWADIYKCVDEAGHVTYTNTKASGRGCSLLARDQAVSSVPSGPRPAPLRRPKMVHHRLRRVSPGRYGHPKGARQRPAPHSRRANWPTSKKPWMPPDGILPPRSSVRSDERQRYQKALERLQPYKDKMQIHERNIEALRKEIANLR
jgi:hypothetical protein